MQIHPLTEQQDVNNEHTESFVVAPPGWRVIYANDDGELVVCPVPGWFVMRGDTGEIICKPAVIYDYKSDGSPYPYIAPELCDNAIGLLSPEESIQDHDWKEIALSYLKDHRG